MWSRLFEEKKLTRFESHQVEEKMLTPLINQLRAKQSQLKIKSEKEGSTSLAYEKYIIISRLLALYDEKLTQFNAQPKDECYENEIRMLSNFIKKLSDMTNSLKIHYEKIIKEPRNGQRWWASQLLTLGSLAAVGAGATVLSFSTFGIGALALFGGSIVDSELQALTGLNNPAASTFNQIENLGKTLESMHRKIFDTIRKWDDPTSNKPKWTVS